jgi:hypothetical protein
MGGVQLYNPKYRHMDIAEIEKERQDELKNYFEYGYNSFTFNRVCGVISIRRIKATTLQEIFLTDEYGLLTNQSKTNPGKSS